MSTASLVRSFIALSQILVMINNNNNNQLCAAQSLSATVHQGEKYENPTSECVTQCFHTTTTKIRKIDEEEAQFKTHSFFLFVGRRIIRIKGIEGLDTSAV